MFNGGIAIIFGLMVSLIDPDSLENNEDKFINQLVLLFLFFYYPFCLVDNLVFQLFMDLASLTDISLNNLVIWANKNMDRL